MADDKIASWCWTIVITDLNHKAVNVKISCPIRFLFDVTLVLLTNQADLSSISVMCNSHVGHIPVSMNTCFKTEADFIIYAYGLKKIHTPTGVYNNVVCSGQICTKWSSCDVPILVTLAESEEGKFPLQLDSKETLPVGISRTPPSIYRLQIPQMYPTSHQFIVFVQIKDQLRCLFLCNKTVDMLFPFNLPSCTLVRCRVLCGRWQTLVNEKCCVTTTISHSKTISFKTFLTLVDNYRLYNMAITFGSKKVVPGFKPIQFFYRNKSVEYYSLIIRYLNGEMRPYLKSDGGEQGSVLNSRLYGLFFSTFLDTETNKPPCKSFYGPIRLNVHATQMFNPLYNLYFGDFYCHYNRHHVTIVLTPKSSPCNMFCQQYLTQLDIFNNPYLCLCQIPDGSFVVLANMDVTVDVFFTEIVNVINILRMNQGYIEKCETVGRGYAPPTGKPKNPACTICNV